MDNNREVRAMLFSCLHLPPLPAVVGTVDRDENVLTGDGVESSHALIGNMIEWVALARDHSKDSERMLEQFALLSEFKEDLLRLDLGLCTGDELYRFYCDHTRKWLGCYAKLGSSAFFKPMDHVTVNDKIHRNMRDYCKAQHFHATDGQTLQLADGVSYEDMLRKCAEWMREAYLSDAIGVC